MTDAVVHLLMGLAELQKVQSSSVPLHIDSDLGMLTMVTYGDVSRALTDHETFSNVPPGAPNASQYAMVFTDPPRHRQLRSLVSKAFTPRSIARLEVRLGELMDELLAAKVGAGELDVVADISDQLPVAMIAEMLGVDTGTRQEFKRWSESFTATALAQSHAQDGMAEHFATLEQMFSYFDAVIQDRRVRPQDDLITALVEAEESGTRLSPEELKATCAQLLAAGNETTTNLIGNAVICLARTPELLARLRKEPILVNGYIEEVLRYASPVQYVPRHVKVDTVVHGESLAAGTTVFAHIGAANRDPDFFDDPDTFWVARDPNRHLGFGLGAHFCLGASLARLEAKVALEHMMRACPGEWVVPETLDRLPEPFFFGVTTLPMTWKTN
jgi:cytochrome P450